MGRNIRMKVLEERTKTLRRRLEELHLDALLVSVPQNRFFMSGFSATDPLLQELSGFVLISRTSRVILTDGRYLAQARTECPEFNVLMYGGDFISVFQKAAQGLEIRSVGIEAGHLTVDFYDRLSRGLGQHGIQVVKTLNLVEPLRVCKSEDEIRKITCALRITERAFQTVLHRLSPGMTEKQAAWMVLSVMHEEGADGPAFEPIVASGPNAALPHAVPTDRVIKSGEPVLFDIGAMKDMYCSDMSRTVVLGEPSERFKELYSLVRTAQLEAIRGVRPGMPTNEVDGLARGLIERSGYGDYFLHSLGHGVGLATHEAPSLRRLNPVELQEGMVITVEPGIYLSEWGGIRLEEMVLVRSDGAEVLNSDRTFYSFV